MRTYQLRKRQRVTSSTAKLSLEEIRAFEKSEIQKIVENHQDNLMQFDMVMRQCVRGCKYPGFRPVRARSDFCDGFLFLKMHCNTSKSLKSFLKGHKLDVLLPSATMDDDYFFVHLASGPFDLAHNL